MKKLLSILMSVVVVILAGCNIQRSDVLVDCTVSGDNASSDVQAEILNIFVQAFHDEGCEQVGQNPASFIFRNQKNLKNVEKRVKNICDNADQKASQIQVQAAKLVIKVSAVQSLFGAKDFFTKDYGRGADPKAKKGVTIGIGVSKVYTDFNTFKIAYTLPGSSDTITEPLEIKGQINVLSMLEEEVPMDILVFEKELTQSGKGTYRIIMERNSAAIDLEKSYFNSSSNRGVCFVDILGTHPFEQFIPDSKGSAKGIDLENNIFPRKQSRLYELQEYEFTK